MTSAAASDFTRHASMLDEPLIRWRDVAQGTLQRDSLPGLFAALAAGRVRDFPALRPHQRHVWHAFLVQLAALALHRAGTATPWTEPGDWRTALLALTPDDSDGAAWCLVAPPQRAAVLQPPVQDGQPDAWKNQLRSADELDMLVTSKNHDIKAARLRRAQADDWLFALVSLQTQEGYLGAGNQGISRMNGGFASRPGVGIAPTGPWARRWAADVLALLEGHDELAAALGMAGEGGSALLWLEPWDGTTSLSFASLDPLYIEVCRRVRLARRQDALIALTTGTKVARVAAKERNGITGDAWTPVDKAEAKALTVSAQGFDYRLISELLTGQRFTQGAGFNLRAWPDETALQLVAQVTVRGQGKTEGYHERRVPIAPALRRLLLGPQRATVAQIAQQRIDAIAAARKLLWAALTTLFANGAAGDASDSVKERANRFARPFEQHEDARFFSDLTEEVEAAEEQRQGVRTAWLLGLVDRAERWLREAFDAGPRSAMRRYQARSAALSRFHGGLRGAKPALPDLAAHYRQQALARTQETIDG